MGREDPSALDQRQMKLARPSFMPGIHQAKWSRLILLGSMVWLICFRYTTAWFERETLIPEITDHIGNLPLILMFHLIGGRYLSVFSSLVLLVTELMPSIQVRPDFADIPAIFVALVVIGWDSHRDKVAANNRVASVPIPTDGVIHDDLSKSDSV
jgi:hypothetical protein